MPLEKLEHATHSIVLVRNPLKVERPNRPDLRTDAKWERLFVRKVTPTATGAVIDGYGLDEGVAKMMNRSGVRWDKDLECRIEVGKGSTVDIVPDEELGEAEMDHVHNERKSALSNELIRVAHKLTERKESMASVAGEALGPGWEYYIEKAAECGIEVGPALAGLPLQQKKALLEHAEKKGVQVDEAVKNVLGRMLAREERLKKA